MLLVALLALVCAIFYASAWRPLSQGIAMNRARAAVLSDDLHWMIDASAKIHALRASEAKRPGRVSGSLLVVVDQSARRIGLETNIAKLALQGGNGAAVSLPNVDFGTLLRWLVELNGEGVAVRRVRLTPGALPGQVQATLLLARGSAG